MFTRAGIDVDDKKRLSADKPIEAAALPDKAYLALAQHRGAPSPRLVVSPGDRVRVGQTIAKPDGNGVALHSPVSGSVESLGNILLPSGVSTPGVTLYGDGRDEWVNLVAHPDWESAETAELVELIRQAGVVGLGGAAFPAHIKLQMLPDKPVDTVIINGCECEPYLTADYRLMIENAPDIIQGARISMRIIGASRCIVALEKGRRQAADAIRAALCDGVTIKELPARYPQGAEKVVIKACTGRHMGAEQLPRDIGVIVHNVATAAAISDAIVRGRPLVERIVTVSGEAIARPANLRVRIGTPVAQLVEQCGLTDPKAATVIAGGPMMGVALDTLNTPVLKSTGGVLGIPTSMLPDSENYGPCIRCGRCSFACPRGHLPYMISSLVEKGRYDEAVEYELMDCLECGCCAFACPAHRPVVDFVKSGKSEVASRRKSS